MKKKKILCLLSALCITFGSIAPAFAAESTVKGIEGEEDVTLDFGASVSDSTRTKSSASNGDLIVTLDPGHGGKDSGATQEWNGKTAMEKEMNLKIALACRDELSKYRGIKVYMTRDDDTFVELSDRVKYAHSVNSDLMVSLHINSADSSSAYGELVIVPNGNYRPALLTESKKTASRIHSNLENLGLHNRGYLQRNSSENKYPDGSKADYYSIIRNSTKANIPSMIVEHAFISNNSDYKNYLSSDGKLKKLGIADADAIAKAYNLKLKTDPISAAENNDAPFEDVYESDWYYNTAVWGYQNHVISGTTKTTFSPDQTCTRAQAVQMLYNLAGNPEIDKNVDLPYEDVSNNAWYATAVKWAYENHVTEGTSETTFSPNDTCTRSQIIQLIWAQRGSPLFSGNTSNFDDVSENDWCYDAVNWAFANKIAAGTSATTFEPNSNCARSAIITFIARAYQDNVA